MSLAEGMIPQLVAVFQDTTDQLAVLGGLMPAKSDPSDGVMEAIVGEEVARIIEEQRELEADYDKLLEERTYLQHDNDIKGLEANEHALKEIAQKLKISTAVLCKNLKSKPGTLDNLMKIHADRQFALDVLESTLDSVQEDRSFVPLVDSVRYENRRRNASEEVIEKEKVSREYLAQLRQDIIDTKKGKDGDIYDRNELIAQLKDQRQEARVRTGMETDYIERSSYVSVQIAAKKKNLTVEDLEAEVIELEKNISLEQTAHDELESFLNRSYARLGKKLDEWTAKYDNDTEMKQSNLESLRDQRAQGLASLKEMTETVNEYQKVISQDRKKKLKQEEEAKRVLLETAAAIRVQAWWRGMLVRHKLGPFKQKKGKSSKKGKKGGKKKKK
eukprot:m.46927 g.46927  ORF g.46927 m.46927 type:complete len:388 (-) comp7297_c0_seq1:969-2132(-)